MKSRELQKTVGAVMVVGGGIAGMQSALDLASTGFYVYLVEAAPAIGSDFIGVVYFTSGARRPTKGTPLPCIPIWKRQEKV